MSDFAGAVARFFQHLRWFVMAWCLDVFYDDPFVTETMAETATRGR